MLVMSCEGKNAEHTFLCIYSRVYWSYFTSVLEIKYIAELIPDVFTYFWIFFMLGTSILRCFSVSQVQQILSGMADICAEKFTNLGNVCF